jgi:hypothetical protein
MRARKKDMRKLPVWRSAFEKAGARPRKPTDIAWVIAETLPAMAGAGIGRKRTDDRFSS